MREFSRYRLIIFDFHKTLTDSVYFDQFDPVIRNRISDTIFRPPHNELWDKRWMTGRLRYRDVLSHLEVETGLPYTDLEDGLLAGIGQIRWNPAVWDFSQSVRKVTRTAIATVNNDLFRDFIVPRYSLSEKFDTIVSSCEIGEYRKDRLCLAAADKLGLTPEKHRILLIDDKPQNIADFIAPGGEGFLYESDESFALWLSGKL